MAMQTPYHSNLVQVRPQWTDASNRIHECVTYWQGSLASGYTSAQLQQVADVFQTQIALLWAIHGTPGATNTGTIASDWTSNTGQTGTSTNAPTIGSGTGELAVNTAMLIQLKQSMKYKGGHGRMYVPSLSGNVTTDGVNLIPGVISDVNTKLQNLINAMFGLASAYGGPYTWVVWRTRSHQPSSAPGGPLGPPIPPFLSTVNSADVAQVLATQRRRLRKAPHH